MKLRLSLAWSWNFQRVFILTAVILFAGACGQIPPEPPPPASADAFRLTLLHTNDVHSAYGGATAAGAPCYEGVCAGGSGGYVRLDQAVRAVRRERPDALFLDAGDIFQGTLFWNRHKARMPGQILDRLGYQALTPGNHEFDDKLPAWLNFVAGLDTPVLAANITLDPPPDQAVAGKIRPYIILERNGRKIGLVGLITEETPQSSSPGPGIAFTDARSALEEAVRELSAQGVDIIIALTHLGLENDRRLARSVAGLDIVAGGHSHSLLSGDAYPVLERTPAGEPALVVTAASAGQYLGRLEVCFDDQGIARSWSGGLIRLDEAGLAALQAPGRDRELEEIINDFGRPIREETQKRLGRIYAPGLADGAPLEAAGVGECRNRECLSGNIVADAMRAGWPGGATQIALLNGGAIRNSLPNGEVTLGQVLGTSPFQNELVRARLSGATIRQALEHGVARYGQNRGAFLQVSGLRYAFSAEERRVTRAEALDENGRWRPLEPDGEYLVTTLAFLAGGGDGFDMLKDKNWEKGAGLDYEAVVNYIGCFSPVRAAFEGRIRVEE